MAKHNGGNNNRSNSSTTTTPATRAEVREQQPGKWLNWHFLAAFVAIALGACFALSMNVVVEHARSHFGGLQLTVNNGNGIDTEMYTTTAKIKVSQPVIQKKTKKQPPTIVDSVKLGVDQAAGVDSKVYTTTATLNVKQQADQKKPAGGGGETVKE